MAKKAQPKGQINSTVAKTDDGTIQINFSIPESVIKVAQEKALKDAAKEITVPGFRKGMAPVEKVKERVGDTYLTEKTLSHILPDAYTQALVKNKIRPITYPKFQVLSQKGDWQVSATIAEFPEVDLGDYKKAIEGEIRSASLKKELTKEEKQNKVIETILQTVKIKVPKVLVADEVDGRLSGLLQRIEKLGLNLDAYLKSIGKTADELRADYEKQVREGLIIELSLNKIAEEEKVEVPQKEVDEALATARQDKTPSEQDKMYVTSVLKRRAVLDRLSQLT